MALSEQRCDWAYLLIIGTQLFGMLGRSSWRSYCNGYHSSLYKLSILSGSTPRPSGRPRRHLSTSSSHSARHTLASRAIPSSPIHSTSHGSRPSCTLRLRRSSPSPSISCINWPPQRPPAPQLSSPAWRLGASLAWGLWCVAIICGNWARIWWAPSRRSC